MNWKAGLYSFVAVLLIGTAVLYVKHKPEPMIQGRMVDKFISVDTLPTYNGQVTRLKKVLARVEVDNLDSAIIATLSKKLFRNFVTEEQENDTVITQFYFHKKSDVHDLDPELQARISLSGPKGAKIASMLKQVDTCVIYKEFSRCLIPPQLPKSVLVIQPFTLPINYTFKEIINLTSK